jgi:hypothetical protein
MCALICLFSYRPSIQVKDRPPKCPRAPRVTALTLSNHKGSQIRFFSQLAHFFACSSHQKRPRPKHAPGALTMPGWRRASRASAMFRACQRFSFDSGEDVRGGAAEDSARTRLTTAHRQKSPPSISSAHINPQPHPPPDLRRGAQPNRICAEVPNRPHPPPDLRRGAHTLYTPTVVRRVAV